MNKIKNLNTKPFLSYVCYSVIFLLFVMVSVCILYNANWIFGDDHQIVGTTAVNKFGLHGHFGQGRFWPLGLCDYNLLILIKGGHTPFGHYLYNIFVLATFLIAIFCLIKEIVKDNQKSLYYFTFSFLILLITKDFINVHINVVYPERMMIFVLSIFMLFYLQGLNSDKTSSYFIAFLSACYLTYCKEPIFGALLAISLTNLLFKYKKMSRNEVLFYVALIINSFIYFLLWYCLAFKGTQGFYNVHFTSNLSVFKFIHKLIIDKPIFILIFGMGFVRAYHILAKKDYDCLFYDSLLFAGIAYAGAFIYLNLFHSYYFLISVILAIPSLIYWIDYGFKLDNSRLSVILMCSVFVLCAWNIDLTIKSVKNTHILREKDKEAIEKLFELQNKNERTIVYYEDPDLKNESQWYYKLYNSFLRCRFNIDTNIPIISSLEEVKPNNVVILPSIRERVKKINFEKISFHPVIDLRFGEVYIHKNNQKI